MNFNLKYLNELFDYDLKVIKELVDTFVQNVPGDLEILESAIKSEDFKQTRILSHKLKSSLALFQADLPRSHMESIELNIKRNQLDLEAINSHFQTAKPQIIEVLNELKTMM
jgi:HPt (histidine-containing phosphotransfer) domain-containing protein